MTSQPAVIEGEPPLFRLRGAVTMDNVQAVLERGRALFDDAAEVTVDLGGVTEVDSSSISLLLHWAREASAGSRRLTYVNPNANVKSLAVLYGVTDLLPLQEDAASGVRARP